MADFGDAGGTPIDVSPSFTALTDRDRQTQTDTDTDTDTRQHRYRHRHRYRRRHRHTLQHSYTNADAARY